MSIISCPKCNKKFDDTIEICPECGFEIKKENIDDFYIESDNVTMLKDQTDIVCTECGNTFSAEVSVCPFCGCPVNSVIEFNSENVDQEIEFNSEKLKIDKKKRNIIIAVVAVIVVIIAIVSAFCYKSYSDKKAEEAAAKEYKSKLDAYELKLEMVCTSMLTGAQEAEKAGTLIHDVWYNCIFEKSDETTDQYTRVNGTGAFYDDFNDALANLYSDMTFYIDIASIEESVDFVSSSMRELKDPPEEFEEAYDAIKKLYDSYNEFTGIVISPSGNLTTFTNNLNNADSDFVKYYKAMKMYIDIDFN